MNPTVRLHRLPALDDPWSRIPWLVPAALAAWMVLLIGFSKLLEQTAPPPFELKPLEARVVELPVGGLQGGPGVPAAPAKPQAQPVRHEEKAHLREIHKSRPKKTEPLAIPASPEGTLKSKEASAAPPSGTATNPGARSIAPESGGTVGSGGGIGSDSVGARAIYHPVPKIPDDLRDQVFQTEAVAHFTVSYEGKVEVTLPKPTSNPRLNQILLDTLTQWTFFPAVKDGIAIDSVFDVRIPISVE